METLGFLWQIIHNNKAYIGPILSGIALLIGSGVAVATLRFIHMRALNAQWVDGFRQIYAEFWKDRDISRVRKWITSDQEYDPLRQILLERMSTGKINNLSAKSNNAIENLDKYLALILRVASFKRGDWDSSRQELWTALYERFWIAKMYERREVREYIYEFWRPLYTETYEQHLRNIDSESARQIRNEMSNYIKNHSIDRILP